MIGRTITLGVLLLASAAAQQTDSPDSTNMACVENLDLPSYPVLARQARITGTLLVTVELDQDSGVKKVSAKGNITRNMSGILLSSIQAALRRSRFNRDCAGKAVLLEFEFRLEGDPAQVPIEEFSFRYPNRFRITSRPPVPSD